jgi:hypothetical protein
VARFVFLIGYIGLVAKGGEWIGQECGAGHSVRKPGREDWPERYALPRKSGVNWRKCGIRRKLAQELSDFADDPNDTYLWTCLCVLGERERLQRCRETS